MNAVFKALNDPSRRRLLDELYNRDGQTLNELCEHLPTMTRFGVMNHIRVLEEAELVTTRKSGRSKFHYLNPVPIQIVHDRWIGKYTQRLIGALAAMKGQLEKGTPMKQPVHVYKAYINCRLEAAWRAITDGDLTVQYFYGTRVESTWEPGAEIRYLGADGGVVADGTVIAIEPPHRLEMSFHAHWDPDLEAEGPLREVWLVEEAEGMTKVSVEMWDVALDSKTYTDFTDGFPFIVSGMKTLLETGAGSA